MKTLIEEYGILIISLLGVVIILLMSTTFNKKAQSTSKYALGDFQAQYEQKQGSSEGGGTDNNIDSPNNPTITHQHNYSVTLSLKEPTCTAQGEEIQKCSKCDKKQVVKIKALGHNYTDKVTLDSTCTELGTLNHTCQRCSYAYNTSIALKPHDVNLAYTVDIEPTCTTLGEYSYHCKDCSYTERRNSIDKLGHDWSNWNTIQDSTCVLYGTKRHKCTRCNETEDAQISLKQHTCGDWIVEAQPTCSYSGTQSKYCTVCSTKLDSATIPSKGHSESCYAKKQTGDYIYKTDYLGGGIMMRLEALNKPILVTHHIGLNIGQTLDIPISFYASLYNYGTYSLSETIERNGISYITVDGEKNAEDKMRFTRDKGEFMLYIHTDYDNLSDHINSIRLGSNRDCSIYNYEVTAYVNPRIERVLICTQ